MRMNLKLFRTARSLSQTEMAKMLGVSYVTYSNIELGKRDGTLKFWEKVKEVFGLDADGLMELMKLQDSEWTA